MPYHLYAYMVVVDLDSEIEQNVITTDQVAVARAKKWSVEGISGEDFYAYDGVETTGLRGDVNGDDGIDINDVTALIDYLLSSHWQ